MTTPQLFQLPKHAAVLNVLPLHPVDPDPGVILAKYPRPMPPPPPPTPGGSISLLVGGLAGGERHSPQLEMQPQGLVRDSKPKPKKAT